MARTNTKHEITTEKDVIDAINQAMIVEKHRIKEGGIQYLIQMYKGTNLLPHPTEIKRVMMFGEGYYY